MLAFSLLVVFSHVFKSPDGSPLFSAQRDPMLVLLTSVVACSVGLAAAIPARSGVHGRSADDTGLRADR